MQHKPPFMDVISQKLGDLLKDSPAKDLESNMKAGLSGMLAKLDLVTREEFDVQAEVLQRTKSQLAILEARLSELESRSKAGHVQD